MTAPYRVSPDVLSDIARALRGKPQGASVGHEMVTMEALAIVDELIEHRAHLDKIAAARQATREALARVPDASELAALTDTSPYEDLDTRRMWGVFDAIGYSSDPIALFRTEQAAQEWLAWDKSRGDERTVWCEPCICAVDKLTGRMWNSTEPVPEAS